MEKKLRIKNILYSTIYVLYLNVIGNFVKNGYCKITIHHHYDDSRVLHDQFDH